MNPFLFMIEPALLVLSAASFALGRKTTATRCVGLLGSVALVGGVGYMAVTGVLKSWGVM